MRTIRYTLMLCAILIADAARADVQTWALPQSVEVNGSATLTSQESKVSASISLTGRQMKPVQVGEYGVTIDGVAEGTYTYTVSSSAKGFPACTASGKFSEEFAFSYGGLDAWVASFRIDGTKPASGYKCGIRPFDVLQVVHLAITSCGGRGVAPRRKAEAYDPRLVIEQVESAPCGSITERAVIVNEQRRAAALPDGDRADPP